MKLVDHGRFDAPWHSDDHDVLNSNAANRGCLYRELAKFLFEPPDNNFISLSCFPSDRILANTSVEYVALLRCPDESLIQ